METQYSRVAPSIFEGAGYAPYVPYTTPRKPLRRQLLVRVLINVCSLVTLVCAVLVQILPLAEVYSGDGTLTATYKLWVVRVAGDWYDSAYEDVLAQVVRVVLSAGTGITFVALVLGVVSVLLRVLWSERQRRCDDDEREVGLRLRDATQPLGQPHFSSAAASSDNARGGAGNTTTAAATVTGVLAGETSAFLPHQDELAALRSTVKAETKGKREKGEGTSHKGHVKANAHRSASPLSTLVGNYYRNRERARRLHERLLGVAWVTVECAQCACMVASIVCYGVLIGTQQATFFLPTTLCSGLYVLIVAAFFSVVGALLTLLSPLNGLNLFSPRRVPRDRLDQLLDDERVMERMERQGVRVSGGIPLSASTTFSFPFASAPLRGDVVASGGGEVAVAAGTGAQGAGSATTGFVVGSGPHGAIVLPSALYHSYARIYLTSAGAGAREGAQGGEGGGREGAAVDQRVAEQGRRTVVRDACREGGEAACGGAPRDAPLHGDGAAFAANLGARGMEENNRRGPPLPAHPNACVPAPLPPSNWTARGGATNAASVNGITTTTSTTPAPIEVKDPHGATCAQNTNRDHRARANKCSAGGGGAPPSTAVPTAEGVVGEEGASSASAPPSPPPLTDSVKRMCESGPHKLSSSFAQEAGTLSTAAAAAHADVPNSTTVNTGDHDNERRLTPSFQHPQPSRSRGRPVIPPRYMPTAPEPSPPTSPSSGVL